MSEKPLIDRLFENPVLRQNIEKVLAFGQRSDDAAMRYKPLLGAAVDAMHHMATLQDALSVIHRFQRLNDVITMGLEHDDSVFAAINDAKHFPLWDQFATFDVPESDLDFYARTMASGDPQWRSPVLLRAADYTRGLTEKILQHLLQKDSVVHVGIADSLFQRRLLHAMNAEKAVQYGEHAAALYIISERTISVMANNPSIAYVDQPVAEDVSTAYQGSWMKTRRTNVPSQFFTLTYVPTPEDAALDGMDYDTYRTMFMAAVRVNPVDQDRANRILIAKLNAASIVHITNNDGTDVTFDITGQTFANSLSNRNVPGSEVFSSPLLHSAKGRIVAKGRFMPMAADQIIEDITIDLQDGLIVSYDAAKGREYLEQMIETDEGSKRIGELAFGTNPAWQDHSVNGLLVEKIGRSFHFAIGGAYRETEYMGEPVKLDNGNRSDVHWDITTMLHNKDGMIALDGVPIMQHGRYLDEGLEFLNGNASLPSPQ